MFARAYSGYAKQPIRTIPQDYQQALTWYRKAAVQGYPMAQAVRLISSRWGLWSGYALSSGLAPVQQFANRVRSYVEGIIASAAYRIHTSVLEGMNNKIKVVKRMAYGYRDNDYFFLKIKAAFPGKAR